MKSTTSKNDNQSLLKARAFAAVTERARLRWLPIDVVQEGSLITGNPLRLAAKRKVERDQ